MDTKNAQQRLDHIEAAWLDCSFADAKARTPEERIEAAEAFMIAVGNVLFGEATEKQPHWMTAIERVENAARDEAWAVYVQEGGDEEDALAFDAYYEAWCGERYSNKGMAS